MKKFWHKTLLLILFSSCLGACSTIKSWFPDKEKDYQFRSEIAPLIIPDDLKAKSGPNLPVPRTPQQIAGDAVRVASNVPAIVQAPVSTVTPATTKNDKPSSVEAKTDQYAKPVASEVSALQVDQGLEQAWRMVGKALSQQKFEIIERNLDNAYFLIRFDTANEHAEYKHFWDEFSFLFGEDNRTDLQYRISLHAIEALSSEVVVEDGEGKLLSNSVANQILKSITEGINRTNTTESSQDSATKKTD